MIVVNDNRMIFPFLKKNHALDFLAGVRKISKKGKNVCPWVLSNMIPHEIRRELRELNLPESSNRIFSSYRLDKNYYGFYGIDYDRIFILPHNRLTEIEFSIENITIHTFLSGVAFLELRYTVKSHNETDALNMNYFLSEVKADIELKIVHEAWNDEVKRKEERSELMTLAKFIQTILVDYDQVRDMDGNETLKSYSSKPVLFSYFLLDKEHPEMAKHLGMNLKESYKIRLNNVHLTSAFDNSTWYYSLNSIVNISYTNEDERTNVFFEVTFVDKLSNLYFFLFLQALHQRSYLQLCQYKIRSFNYEPKDFDATKRLVDGLSEYSSSVNKACLNFFFSKPASIDHVNVFYSTVREAFDIADQMESVKADLKRLTNYTSQKYKLFDEHNKLISEKKKNWFDLVTFLVASILSFVSIYDIFIKMIKNFGIELSVSAHVASAISFMSACFILPTVINFYFNIKKIKKIDEEIRYLENVICEHQ